MISGIFRRGRVACQIGDLLHCRFALQQSFQDQLSRHAEHIGENAADFDIRFFQDLLHSVSFADGIVEHLLPPPDQDHVAHAPAAKE
jgi:hypothetical protein